MLSPAPACAEGQQLGLLLSPAEPAAEEVPGRAACRPQPDPSSLTRHGGPEQSGAALAGPSPAHLLAAAEMLTCSFSKALQLLKEKRTWMKASERT